MTIYFNLVSYDDNIYGGGYRYMDKGVIDLQIRVHLYVQYVMSCH